MDNGIYEDPNMCSDSSGDSFCNNVGNSEWESFSSSPESEVKDDNKKSVFSLLWHNYCNASNKSDYFAIFKQPKMNRLSNVDCSFKFDDFNEIGVILTDPKNAKELWQHYYTHMEKEVIAQKYGKQVKNFFERNEVTQFGCVSNTIKQTSLLPILIEENFELSKPFEEVTNPVDISNKVTFTANKKCLIAADCIREKETIIIEEASITSVPPSCKCNNGIYQQCFRCRSPIVSPYYCPTCYVAVFCSKSCRRVSKVYHRWECRAVKTHFFQWNSVVFVAFRMFMIGITCNFDDSAYYDRLRRLPADIRLFSFEQLRQLVKMTLQVMLYLTNYTTIFEWMEANSILTDITDYDKKNIFLGSVFLRHATQVITNTLYFPFEEYSFFFPTKGAAFSVPAIFPTVIRLVQNCQPNSKLVFKGNYCVVKALRKIDKGEVLTVNFYQTQECEVYNVRKMFFSIRKMKCTCKECRQPYNEKYGEVLLRCKLCCGIAGIVDEQWQCFQCKHVLNAGYMDSRKKLMESKYMYLQRYRFNDLDGMMEFLQEYPIIYCELSRQYLEVAMQCLKKLLYEQKYVKFFKMAQEIIEVINMKCHKYSFLKLHVTIKIMNCVLVYCRIVSLMPRLASLLYACSKEIEEICQFYCLSSELEMLNKIIWNVGFVAMRPTEDDVARLKSLSENILTEEDRLEAEHAYAAKLEEAEKMMVEPDISQILWNDLDCFLVPFWTKLIFDVEPKDNQDSDETKITHSK